MQDSIKISGLESMIAPEGLAFWPPAPGWYGIFALTILLLVFLAVRSLKSWKKNGYRRVALRQLQSIFGPELKQIRPSDIAALNRILKITAMHYYTRERVASLTGDSWLEFLDACYAGSNFTTVPGRFLANSGFRSSAQLDITPDQWTSLLEESKKWIRKHH